MMQLVYAIVYHPLVNRFLRAINKWIAPGSFRLPPSGEITVSTREASFRMKTNQTSYVTKLLFYDGAEAFEYTPIFVRIISSCRTFLDVGANTGYYSLLGTTLNKNLRAFAFEPAPSPLEYLTKNVVLNRKERQIMIQSVALDNQRGSAQFYAVVNRKYPTTPDLGGTGSLQLRNQGSSVQVETIPLDDWAKLKEIDHVDVIKIDTEGTEDRILLGAAWIIGRDKPIIICETLFNRIEGKLEDIMRTHGYEFYHVTADRVHLTRIDTLRRTADDGVRDCFMLHPSRKQLLIDAGLLVA